MSDEKEVITTVPAGASFVQCQVCLEIYGLDEVEEHTKVHKGPYRIFPEMVTAGDVIPRE